MTSAGDSKVLASLQTLLEAARGLDTSLPAASGAALATEVADAGVFLASLLRPGASSYSLRSALLSEIGFLFDAPAVHLTCGNVHFRNVKGSEWKSLSYGVARSGTGATWEPRSGDKSRDPTGNTDLNGVAGRLTLSDGDASVRIVCYCRKSVFLDSVQAVADQIGPALCQFAGSYCLTLRSLQTPVPRPVATDADLLRTFLDERRKRNELIAAEADTVDGVARKRKLIRCKLQHAHLHDPGLSSENTMYSYLCELFEADLARERGKRHVTYFAALNASTRKFHMVVPWILLDKAIRQKRLAPDLALVHFEDTEIPFPIKPQGKQPRGLVSYVYATGYPAYVEFQLGRCADERISYIKADRHRYWEEFESQVIGFADDGRWISCYEAPMFFSSDGKPAIVSVTVFDERATIDEKRGAERAAANASSLLPLADRLRGATWRSVWSSRSTESPPFAQLAYADGFDLLATLPRVPGFLHSRSVQQILDVLKLARFGLEEATSKGAMCDVVKGAMSSVGRILEVPHDISKQQEHLLLGERVLEVIPSYRDHYIHHFLVFATGFSIALHLCGIQNSKAKNYRNALGARNRTEFQRFLRLWYLATTFHDFGYALLEAGTFLDTLIARMIGRTDNEDGPHADSWGQERSGTLLPPPRNMLVAVPDYVVNLETLARALAKRIDTAANGTHFSRARAYTHCLLNRLDNGGHEVLSAVHFMRVCASAGDWGADEDALEVAMAILAHHRSLWAIADPPHVEPHCFALGYLLAFCDFVQNWGRIVLTDERDRYEVFGNETRLAGIEASEEGSVVRVRLCYGEAVPDARRTKLNTVCEKIAAGWKGELFQIDYHTPGRAPYSYQW